MASWFNRSSTGAMSDLWLGDVGIRVTNLERSIEFYYKGVRSGADRSRRGRRREVRPLPRPAFRPAIGTELVRRTQSVLDPLRFRRGARSLWGPCEERAGDARATQEIRHRARDEKALGQPEDRRHTERGSEVS